MRGSSDGSSDSLNPDEAELLRRAAAGDKEAFGVIFERYQHVVYRFARAMTGSADAAEDVTQEVFVVLIRDLRRYQPERAALATYLYGIARNMSRDRVRRERRMLSLASLGLERHATAADPLERMVTAESGAEVRRALSRMPLKYREAVILCDLHHLAYAQVGAILGTTVGAVRSRLHRGRQLLKRQLSRPEDASAVRRRGPPCAARFEGGAT